MIIWKQSYRPFMLGGDVNAPIGLNIDLSGTPYFDLGGGYRGHLVVNPRNGTTCVVEAGTGAIIGDTIAEVRKDVKEGDPEAMTRQITWAEDIVARRKVDVVSSERFWS